MKRRVFLVFIFFSFCTTLFAQTRDPVQKALPFLKELPRYFHINLKVASEESRVNRKDLPVAQTIDQLYTEFNSYFSYSFSNQTLNIRELLIPGMEPFPLFFVDTPFKLKEADDNKIVFEAPMKMAGENPELSYSIDGDIYLGIEIYFKENPKRIRIVKKTFKKFSQDKGGGKTVQYVLNYKVISEGTLSTGLPTRADITVPDLVRKNWKLLITKEGVNREVTLNFENTKEGSDSFEDLSIHFTFPTSDILTIGFIPEDSRYTCGFTESVDPNLKRCQILTFYMWDGHHIFSGILFFRLDEHGRVEATGKYRIIKGARRNQEVFVVESLEMQTASVFVTEEVLEEGELSLISQE